jgi:hypothetical protein
MSHIGAEVSNEQRRIVPDDGSTEETREGSKLPPIEDDIRLLSRRFSEDVKISEDSH